MARVRPSVRPGCIQSGRQPWRLGSQCGSRNACACWSPLLGLNVGRPWKEPVRGENCDALAGWTPTLELEGVMITGPCRTRGRDAAALLQEERRFVRPDLDPGSGAGHLHHERRRKVADLDLDAARNAGIG